MTGGPQEEEEEGEGGGSPGDNNGRQGGLSPPPLREGNKHQLAERGRVGDKADLCQRFPDAPPRGAPSL